MMDEFKLLYPKVAQLIAGIPSATETFLFDRMSNTEYPFWTEFEYFLSNSERLGNVQEILRKLCSEAPLSLEITRAWEKQRDFRSAQFEITTVFLIENYFGGKVQLIPEANIPTADFDVELGQRKFAVEAKTQSGQQHGDKHPRHNDLILFNPKGEIDLRSWLFEERISSRSGRAMEPQFIAAENKGADVLVCQKDYMKTKDDFVSQVSILCPENTFLEEMTLECPNREPVKATFFRVNYPCKRQLNRLKEIWLCDLSGSRYNLVVLSRTDAVLNEHLKNIR